MPAISDKKTSKPSSPNRSVTFSVVQVREYERIVGDHPDACHGPALGLGWKFVQKEDKIIPTDMGTDNSSNCKLSSLNGETRRFILVHLFDIPSVRLLQAEREACRIRRQRHQTIQLCKHRRMAKRQGAERTENSGEMPTPTRRRMPTSNTKKDVSMDTTRPKTSKRKSVTDPTPVTKALHIMALMATSPRRPNVMGARSG